MQRPHRGRLFRRIGIVLILAVLGVALLVMALDADKGMASFQIIESASDVLTPTHFAYLPFVSDKRPCADPPSGTVMIAGQATVHGKPAQPGIPFRLSRQDHWSIPATTVETVTTSTDGSFCFGPVQALPYCYAMWYWVYFYYAEGTIPEDDYAPSWDTRVFACESGKVYTVSAEIGRQAEQRIVEEVEALPLPGTFHTMPFVFVVE